LVVLEYEEYCCLYLQVKYNWESLDSWTAIPAGGYALKDLVLPPPVPAEAGQTYKLRLSARFEGSTTGATATVSLTAVGSPLTARLLGPSGDIMGDTAISLDASQSQDPDDPKVCGSNRPVLTVMCTAVAVLHCLYLVASQKAVIRHIVTTHQT
jgi:hypothetical protein